MKLTETLATVKITGTGSDTIVLATDLLSPTQELSGAGEQNVGIQFIQWTTGGNITITRNAVTVFELYGATGIFDLSGYNGMLDTQESLSDIVVTITGGGSLLINLRKIAGYNSKIEPYAFGQYDNPEAVGS